MVIEIDLGSQAGRLLPQLGIERLCGGNHPGNRMGGGNR